MSSLFRDASFALRLLRRSPGFTAVAVATLALGIAATTAIFSVVYGLFFAPLPYRQADRLVMVWEQERGERRLPNARTFLEWKRQATGFSDINAWGGASVNLATDDRPENVAAGTATPGFLGMLGYGHPLALGRTFHEEEGVVGRHKVVILTYRLWQERFGGAADIIGRQVRVDDEPHTVVGVLGEGPADHQQNKIWLPLALTEDQLATGGPGVYVMGRLADGVGLEEADAGMKTLATAIAETRPERRSGWSTSVEPFRNNFVRDSTKRGVWLLLGAVGFLLLIACVNVANLLLARGTTRQRELAIRTSMGATAGAIARQLLVESLVVSLIGGLAGAALASLVVDAIVALMPAYTLPSETEVVLSVPVLLFAFAACALAGLGAGSVPAWQASRASVSEVMKEGGRSVSVGRHALRRALVAVEFALALTLLAGGGMAVHALSRLMAVDPGFRPERLLTLDLPVSRGRLTTPAQAEAFYRTALERIRALPGVESASISTGLPVVGTRFGRNWEIVGRPPADPSNLPGGGLNMATPGYDRTLGIALRRGRSLTDSDHAAAPRVATVNESFVELYLRDVDPIGQRIRFSPAIPGSTSRPAPVDWEIVGVTRNVANAGLAERPFPEVTVSFWQMPWPVARLAVRTAGDPLQAVGAIGDVIGQLDSTVPLTDVRTMEQALSRATASDRFYAVFFAAFAGVALVLAAVGIYGVMAFAVAQRTPEIGLRMALGARQGQVLSQILREGMTTAIMGTGIGIVAALALGKALEGAIYGVDSSNPWTLVAVAMLLLTAAFLACVVPARRAAAVDPMVALRQD
jgi:putative ABC transport system permease protein